MDESLPSTGEDQKRRAFLHQMNLLVHSFPSIRDYCSETPQTEPFDPDRFAQFYEDLTDASAVHAATFVHSVFVGSNQGFDFFAAFSAWDREHKTAFFRWCHTPCINE